MSSYTKVSKAINAYNTIIRLKKEFKGVRISEPVLLDTSPHGDTYASKEPVPPHKRYAHPMAHEDNIRMGFNSVFLGIRDSEGILEKVFRPHKEIHRFNYNFKEDACRVFENIKSQIKHNDLSPYKRYRYDIVLLEAFREFIMNQADLNAKFPIHVDYERLKIVDRTTDLERYVEFVDSPYYLAFIQRAKVFLETYLTVRESNSYSVALAAAQNNAEKTELPINIDQSELSLIADALDNSEDFLEQAFLLSENNSLSDGMREWFAAFSDVVPEMSFLEVTGIIPDIHGTSQNLHTDENDDEKHETAE